MKKKIYWYVITDAEGNRSGDVCSDSSDWICVHGTTASGKYQQFDSTEAYHVYRWAEEHGFKVESGEMTIDLPIEG